MTRSALHSFRNFLELPLRATPVRRRGSAVPATASAAAGRCVIEGVEPRILFHLEQVQPPLADLTVTPGSPATLIDLAGRFDNEEITGSVVRMTTDFGNLDIELFDAQKPTTVANFLGYVNRGDYVNTIFHRSSNLGGAQLAPIQIIQGGGYELPDRTRIPTQPAIPLEVQANGVIANTRGTIAMARTGDPDSATSEFFINTTDNTDTLGPDNGGGYAVFGELINNTIAGADAIAALPRGNAGGAFTTLPVKTIAGGTAPDNLVVVRGTEVIPEIRLTVSSSNTAVVQASLVGSTLALEYAAGASGASVVSVTATDPTGATINDSFVVTLGAAVTEVRIGDGTESRAATFQDADGTAGTVSVKGGAVSLLFSGADVTQAPGRGGVVVGGAGLRLVGVSATGTTAATALAFAGRGGADGRLDVGGVTADGAVKSISGKTVGLTGELSVNGELGKLDLLRADDARITIGGAPESKGTTISIGTIADSQINASGPVSLKTGGWSTSVIGEDFLLAPAVGSLSSAGDFSPTVFLLAPGPRTLGSAKVGGAVNGSWDVSSAGKITLGSTGPEWNSRATGDVGSFTVAGNYDGTLSVGGAMKGMKVGGNFTGDLNFTQGFAAGAVALKKLAVGGAIDGAFIRSVNSLGSITAAALTRSSIYAGLNVPDGGVLPDTAGAFAQAATITALTLKARGTPAFVASQVAASTLGKMTLGAVSTDNGGVPFGLAARSITSLNATTAGGEPLRFARLTEPADSKDVQDFEVRVF